MACPLGAAGRRKSWWVRERRNNSSRGKCVAAFDVVAACSVLSQLRPAVRSQLFDGRQFHFHVRACVSRSHTVRLLEVSAAKRDYASGPERGRIAADAQLNNKLPCNNTCRSRRPVVIDRPRNFAAKTERITSRRAAWISGSVTLQGSAVHLFWYRLSVLQLLYEMFCFVLRVTKIRLAIEWNLRSNTLQCLQS